MPGQITDLRRRGFNASVAALTLGGPLGDPYTRVLDATGRPGVPGPPELTDVIQVEQVTGLFTALDLRYGGGLVSQLAKYVLRWAVGMLDSADTDAQAARRLDAAIGHLAARAAWAVFDVDAHEPARALFRLALFCAARSGDPDLQGHILADVAAQHSHLGYFEDALQVVRMTEGDDRLSPAVRMVVHGVKARAYAGLGNAEQCRGQLELVEQAYHRVHPHTGGWQASVCTAAHLEATAGHATATLALRTNSAADLREADQRLTRAVAAHDPTTHARAVALCETTAARVNLALGAVGSACVWAHQALDRAGGLFSARLTRALTELRQAATQWDSDPDVAEMVERIDLLVQDDPDDPEPQSDTEPAGSDAGAGVDGAEASLFAGEQPTAGANTGDARPGGRSVHGAAGIAEAPVMVSPGGIR